jgi:hypothetical protein
VDFLIRSVRLIGSHQRILMMLTLAVLIIVIATTVIATVVVVAAAAASAVLLSLPHGTLFSCVTCPQWDELKIIKLSMPCNEKRRQNADRPNSGSAGANRLSDETTTGGAKGRTPRRNVPGPGLESAHDRLSKWLLSSKTGIWSLRRMGRRVSPDARTPDRSAPTPELS